MRQTRSFGVESKRGAYCKPGVHLGPQAFRLKMERSRVTPERIDAKCREAVETVLAQVAKLTGFQCDAKVQCVFNQYVKGQRYLEFSWSVDSIDPLTMAIRADEVVSKNRLKPPHSWVLSVAYVQLPKVLRSRPPRWLKQGEKVILVAVAKEAEVPAVRWVTDEGNRVRPVLPLSRIKDHTHVCHSFSSGSLNLRGLAEYEIDDVQEPPAKRQRGESLLKYAMDNKREFDMAAAVATFKAEEARAKAEKRDIDMIVAQSSLQMNPFAWPKGVRKVIVMISRTESSRACVKSLSVLLRA